MSLNGSWIRGSKDYFWTLGCCSVCSLPEKKENCWCSHVKCHECEWYEGETIENEEHEDLTHLRGTCSFRYSNFGFPVGKEPTIRGETEKAILVKYSDYPNFWVPKKGCAIEKDDDFEYITVKGWFLIIKANEYEKKKDKSEKDKELANLYRKISREYMN